MKVADSAWRARKSRLSIGTYDYREPIVMQRMEEENNYYKVLTFKEKKFIIHFLDYNFCHIYAFGSCFCVTSSFYRLDFSLIRQSSKEVVCLRRAFKPRPISY